MAKKRVHELAKQYDMPTAEVIKRLEAYYNLGSRMVKFHMGQVIR